MKKTTPTIAIGPRGHASSDATVAAHSTPEELMVAFIATYASPRPMDEAGATHIHDDERPEEDAQTFLARLSRALIAKTQ